VILFIIHTKYFEFQERHVHQVGENSRGDISSIFVGLTPHLYSVIRATLEEMVGY